MVQKVERDRFTLQINSITFKRYTVVARLLRDVNLEQPV